MKVDLNEVLIILHLVERWTNYSLEKAAAKIELNPVPINTNAYTLVTKAWRMVEVLRVI